MTVNIARKGPYGWIAWEGRFGHAFKRPISQNLVRKCLPAVKRVSRLSSGFLPGVFLGESYLAPRENSV